MVNEKTIMIWGTILVLLVPGACAVSLVGVGSFVNDIEAQSMEEVAPVPPIVTLAEFEQLETRMSYRQVVDVIGDPGIEVVPQAAPGSSSGDAETSSYVWQNSDASNMQATFQNDQLLEKSQVFLE